MSVVVKGLIMPSCCDGCTFSDWSNLHQTACCKLHDYDPCFADYSREYEDKRADFCPLIEIPANGRLIDADKMCADLVTVDPQYETMIEWCIQVTNAQPTVIEGSENHDD